MQVDMGYIIQYNTSTGAGLLNPTFLTNQDRNQKVHFDHSTVGDKNLEQRLQKKTGAAFEYILPTSALRILIVPFRFGFRTTTFPFPSRNIFFKNWKSTGLT